MRDIITILQIKELKHKDKFSTVPKLESGVLWI